MGSVNFLFAVSHKSALVIHISPASPSERTRSRDSFIVVYPTVPAAQRTARGLHGRRDAMAVDSRRVSWNGAALAASGCRRGWVVVVVVAFRGCSNIFVDDTDSLSIVYEYIGVVKSKKWL